VRKKRTGEFVGFDNSLEFITVLAVLDALVVMAVIPWILAIKHDSTAAVSWCLAVLLMPLFGALLFVVFGYTYVHRPLRRKRRHREGFRQRSAPPLSPQERRIAEAAEYGYQGLGSLALKLGAFPVRSGNEITTFHDTRQAHQTMIDAIDAAEHHVHVQFYIVQSDSTGRGLIDLLARKARDGVEVRLLYDAIGSWTLKGRLLRPLVEAGGRCAAFLGLHPLRRPVINLRNHRKIVVVDGRVAFTGGMNIGDEYLGKVRRFGQWRDTQLRLAGPAVADLQRIFIEDWDFACAEFLEDKRYTPNGQPAGDAVVQIVDSGPDQEINSIRELIFAAITSARQYLWISSPYLVPDLGIRDALNLAARRGVDVRLIGPSITDHFLTKWASRFYWTDLMAEGVKLFLYQDGMMHAKMMIVDGRWGWAGTANLDPRSLKLNFENICVYHSREHVAQLQTAYERDLSASKRVEPRQFAARPAWEKLLENGCRLFSPAL